MKLIAKVVRCTQVVLIPLMFMIPLSSQIALADDNLNCDWFTGHCYGDGPYDKPGQPWTEDDGEGPERPEPFEADEPLPSTPVGAPQPVTPPSSPTTVPNGGDSPPICSRKPDLPQCL